MQCEYKIRKKYVYTYFFIQKEIYTTVNVIFYGVRDVSEMTLVYGTHSICLGPVYLSEMCMYCTCLWYWSRAAHTRESSMAAVASADSDMTDIAEGSPCLSPGLRSGQNTLWNRWYT